VPLKWMIRLAARGFPAGLLLFVLTPSKLLLVFGVFRSVTCSCPSFDFGNALQGNQSSMEGGGLPGIHRCQASL
jgi:hypothetical protein